MNCFAHVVVHHPYLILVAVSVFCATCFVIPLVTLKFPEFSDPQSGFETRGTVLSERKTAWDHLLDATSSTGELCVNPQILKVASTTMKPFKRRKFKPHYQNISFVDMSIGKKLLAPNKKRPNYTEEISKWKKLLSLEPLDHTHTRHDYDHDHDHVSGDGYFCGTPGSEYAHVVIGSVDGSNLFTFDSLMSICHIERAMSLGDGFNSLCINRKPGHCCHFWSLPNYVAMINNRTSCLSIVEEDVKNTISILQLCSQFYHNLQLTADYQVPSQCTKHDAVDNIFKFLVDSNFLPPNDTSNTFLKYTMLFLPMASSTATLSFYRSLDSLKLKYHNIKVVAMEFGLKQTLFDEYILRDLEFISTGLIFVVICMWIYTDSLFITLMTVMAIVYSLGTAYFIYTLVFELRFFPFMNLLASVVSVGIGADDAFIFCKVWQCGKTGKNNNSILKLVAETLHHAVLSMFVTSLTTAAAFYASFISSITAVCCFSIFAGTAVITNFLLMITWFPACIVISQRWSRSASILSRWKVGRAFRAFLDDWCEVFEKLVVALVLKLRWFWLVVLGCCAAASIVVVVHHLQFILPDSPNFQLFDSSHPFEQYDTVFKDLFAFEQQHNNDGTAFFSLPLRFVWGVSAVDNGDYLDPHVKGTIEYDETFDVAAPESQQWLLKFCQDLRTQDFYQSTRGPLLPNCFVESFASWMERRCRDPIDGIDRTPCCESSKFPYEREVFEKCIVDAIFDLYSSPSEIFMPGVAGPKFSKDVHPSIKALVVEYNSNYFNSMSFTEMNEFYDAVETWMQSQLETAPLEMKNGWFISELSFYDLQETLSRGTLLSVGISMCIALIVLLTVTLNILVSCYAILSISCIIFVTIAILLLLGWKLNVLESIAVSTAIGLAVDFSLHYGVNYDLSNRSEDRISATKFAISRMAGPTAMAALTTGAAGIFMLPSSVLAYVQIGMFLSIVMTVSWIYSTFLFGSILSIAGPENGFGRFSYSSIFSCKKEIANEGDVDERDGGDRRKNSIPQSSAVPSSHGSESHELETLTAKSSDVYPSTSKASRGSDSSGKPRPTTMAPLVSYSNRKPCSQDQSPSATSTITIIMADNDDKIEQ